MKAKKQFVSRIIWCGQVEEQARHTYSRQAMQKGSKEHLIWHKEQRDKAPTTCHLRSDQGHKPSITPLRR